MDGPLAGVVITAIAAAAAAVVVAMIKFIPQRATMEAEQRMEPEQQQQLRDIQESVNELTGDMKVVQTRLSRSDMDITSIRDSMAKNADSFQRQLDAIRTLLLNIYQPSGPINPHPHE